ncbi:MAG TPA: type II secretion system F family protein [Gaiellaceae bacterium]
MRRSGLLAAALAGIVVLASSTAATAGNGLRLRPTAGATFPGRAYVLTLPSAAALSPDAIQVRENGQLMRGVSVTPAEAAATGQFGVVLVIDTSRSMRGPAIAGALEAARAFAQHRQANQLLGIVTFNDKAIVVLPFTTDAEAINAALAGTPKLHEGTHVYDGVALAVSMLKQAKVSVGSVVVLSDGTDTGSSQSLDDAVAAAHDARVRIFSVGLHSRTFSPRPLGRLARLAGGEYLEAHTAADLTPIFDTLGARFASEYLIRYRSTAPANKSVIVAVTVKGFPGAATAGYVTPETVEPSSAPFQRSVLDKFVQSVSGMLTTAVLAAGLIALGLLVLIRPRRVVLRRRLAEFVSTAEAEEKLTAQARKDRLYARAERSFEGMQWWVQFKEDLDVARISIPPVQIVAWTAIGTLIAVYIFAVVFGTLAGILGFSVPLIVRAIIQRKLERERQAFAEQLPDNLQVLASALRAGHSLVGALSVVVEDSPDPSRREFQRVIADEQLGVPLEEAFEVVARRMNSTDVRQVGLVAALQHETGGNTAEVLDRVADTVRERFELRRLVKTLTAQGRMTRWILTGLPILLLVTITLLNPTYIQPLYSHGSGRVVLVIAALMVISGSLFIRRIIRIRV